MKTIQAILNKIASFLCGLLGHDYCTYYGGPEVIEKCCGCGKIKRRHTK